MMQRLILASSTLTVIGTFIIVSSVQSQVILDRTTNTSVVDNCQVSCNLTGGTAAGDNLFHSFEEFNVAPEASVYFDDPGVANIFSRVTGSNLSAIFGTLGVRGGDANLFLLNPNGVIFGEGASLDLNGSFFATTADKIQFGDRSFSAIPTEQEDLALLTVNPSALLFTQMDRAGAITLNGAELTAAAGQSIALLGRGNNNLGVELKNSTIDVTEGNISLGAVNGDAEITFQDFQLEFPPNVVRGDISITDGSQVTATNLDNLANTAIKIDSNNLNLGEGSKISTFTTGIQESLKGANIAIDAQSSVTITGENSTAFQTFIAENLIRGGRANLSNGLETTTFGAGDAGDIEITTPNLTIDRGAGIISTTRNQGNSGNINLDLAEHMHLTASGLLTASGTFTSGDVGEINIAAEELFVERNSVISSSTLGEGNAGSINIVASKVIEIKDTSAGAIVPTGIFTNTIFENGDGGNLYIDTPRLILRNGGQLSASSGAVFITENGLDFIRSGGVGGNIDLTIENSLEVEGTSVDGAFPSGILSDTRSSNSAGNVTIKTNNLYVDSDGLISASSLGNGEGGNITVDARNSVDVRGEISVRSSASGAAGTLTIDADSISLRDRGNLNGTTISGRGGNIDLRVKGILEIGARSIIDTNASQGNGGNIDIAADFVIARSGSSIAANALEEGNGGNISITANDIFLTADSNITADSALGIDGTVKIETLVDTERNNLTRLPQKVVRANNKVTRSCSNNSDRQGVFSYTGRGGLPFNPLTDFQTGDVLIADLDIPATEIAPQTQLEANFKLDLLPSQAVEAERWQVNANGKVELTASNNSTMFDFGCPLAERNG